MSNQVLESIQTTKCQCYYKTLKTEKSPQNLETYEQFSNQNH